MLDLKNAPLGFNMDFLSKFGNANLARDSRIRLCNSTAH